MYTGREAYVTYVEYRTLAVLYDDKRRCTTCAMPAWEGRHTSPCKDGDSCANPQGHHPFLAAPMPEHHIVLPAWDEPDLSADEVEARTRPVPRWKMWDDHASNLAYEAAHTAKRSLPLLSRLERMLANEWPMSHELMGALENGQGWLYRR